jgi:hypothetical protein
MFLRALLFLATFLFLISFEVKAEMINLLCISDDANPEENKGLKFYFKIDTANKSVEVRVMSPDSIALNLTNVTISENKIRGNREIEERTWIQGGTTVIFHIDRFTGVMYKQVVKNVFKEVSPTLYFNCVPAKAKF